MEKPIKVISHDIDDIIGDDKDKFNDVQEVRESTFEIPVNPSLTLGMITIWVGAWGAMSLKARICQGNEKFCTFQTCFQILIKAEFKS